MPSSGIAKVNAAKRIKQGKDERFSDFYRPVRETIVGMHTSGLGTVVLDDLVASLVDPRERRLFPKVVDGYKRFLGSAAKMVWFEPPMRNYPLGPVAVRVSPEVGLLIDGRPYAIKLYFRGDPIAPERVGIVNQLLANALSTTWPGTTFAVLDVRRARLYPYLPKTDLGLLLKAEALHLAYILESL